MNSYLNKIIKLEVKGVSSRKDSLSDIGRKFHLSITHTIPYISYVVSVVRQFMHDPRKRHIQVVDKILKYLKSSPFRREDIVTIKIYSEANYKVLLLTKNLTPLDTICFLGKA